MPSPRSKGKKRAASPSTSVERVRARTNEIRKRLKREPAPTPCPPEFPSRPRSKASASRSSSSKGGLSSKSQQWNGTGGDQDAGASGEFVEDGRVNTLLSRSLSGKDVEKAIQDLVEDSFKSGSDSVYPEPGRSFLERLIKHLRLRHENAEQSAELAVRLRQCWHGQMAAFLAVTVTTEDDVQHIATSFGQNLKLDSPHHGFSFNAQVKSPSIGALIAHLARWSPASATPVPSDNPSQHSTRPALKDGDVKRAAAAFCQYTEQLRLLGNVADRTSSSHSQLRKQDKAKFKQLRPYQQRHWLRVHERIRRRCRQRFAGARPWRLLLEHNIPELLDIDINARLRVSQAPPATTPLSPPLTDSSASVHPGSSQTALGCRQHTSPPASSTIGTTQTCPSRVSGLSSHADFASSSLSAAPLLPFSSTHCSPTSKLPRPSASTIDALRDRSPGLAFSVPYVPRACRADLSVLFTVNVPGRPETDVTASAIRTACEKAFAVLSYDQTRQLPNKLVAVTFKQPGCATRAMKHLLDVNGTMLTPEPVFSNAPTLFAAELSLPHVSDGEVAFQISRALQKWDGKFTVERSALRKYGQDRRHALVRFSAVPALQCFFVPMQTRDGTSRRRFWAWFRPVSPKTPCTICHGRHEDDPCPLASAVPLPSTYRPSS